MCYTEAHLKEGTVLKITKLTSRLLIFFQVRSLSLSRLEKKEKVSVARMYLLLDWSKVVLELAMLSCSLASALETAFQLCMQGKLYFLTVLQ